jgi:hypothetical protein
MGTTRIKSADLRKKVLGGASQFLADDFFERLNFFPGKKIAVTLKNSTGAAVANTEVKFAIFEFDSAIPQNLNFMQLVSKGVYTTDASGNIELNYTGVAAIGSYAYLAILHPNSSPVESVLWKVTIS